MKLGRAIAGLCFVIGIASGWLASNPAPDWPNLLAVSWAVVAFGWIAVGFGWIWWEARRR